MESWMISGGGVLVCLGLLCYCASKMVRLLQAADASIRRVRAMESAVTTLAEAVQFSVLVLQKPDKKEKITKSWRDRAVHNSLHALKAAGIVPTAAVAPEPVEPQEAQA